MTTGFIVMAALLVLCIGLLFVPWSGRRSISRDGLNQLIYRQRLRELDENRDAIDASQREALVTDLQKICWMTFPLPPARAPGAPARGSICRVRWCWWRLRLVFSLKPVA